MSFKFFKCVLLFFFTSVIQALEDRRTLGYSVFVGEFVLDLLNSGKRNTDWEGGTDGEQRKIG